jgi:Mce-associated membrane protein
MTKDDMTDPKNDEAEPEAVEPTEPTEVDEVDATTDSDEADAITDAHDAESVEATDSDSEERYLDEYEALMAQPPPRTLLRRLLVPVALAVLLLASIGVTTWFYLEQFRPDLQTNDAARATVMEAASTGTTSLLSYSPQTLDKDFATAKTHLTGDFLNYYTQFTHDIVTPAAKEKSVKTSAAIVQSAVAEMRPDSAVVLLYLNQTTTSQENPDGSFTASSVKVGMKKVGNDWLISSFDPV